VKPLLPVAALFILMNPQTSKQSRDQQERSAAQFSWVVSTLKLSVPPDDVLSMKCILSFALVYAATAFAASRAETTTYVDGNLAGVSPNTGGTLLFSDEKAMYFRTGLATVSVPYSAITRSELGATREISHGAPIYKVWARHKKTETQFLTVEFKGEEGDAKTMTLELAQASAPAVLATIQDHRSAKETTEVASAAPAPAPEAAPVRQEKAPKPAPTPASTAGNSPAVNPNDAGSKATPPTKAGSSWWGDDIWKTTRNAGTWTKPTGTNAPEE
jgi:hypothetical protein